MVSLARGVPRVVTLLLTAVLAAATLVALGPSAPASASAHEVTTLLNQARAAAGLRLLARNSAMDAVAQRWTDSMAASGRLAHNPNFSRQIPGGWTVAGENVGYSSGARPLHDAWMRSTGHRANILEKRYTSVGIGYRVDGRGRVWSTQVFATYANVVPPPAPAPAPPPPPPPAPPRPPVLPRLEGADRYATAARTALAAFSTAGTVYVTTGRDFPDALGAGPAAAELDGPVLLVNGGVPPVTRDALKRLKPRRIVILGSEGVVSRRVADELRGLAGTVTRLGGDDRYATAARVALETFPDGTKTVFVATGGNFPDALGGGVAAARAGAPVLLVGRDVPKATRDALSRLRPQRIVILGSTGVVPAAVETELRRHAGTVTRLAGRNRYATAAEVARAAFPNGAQTVYVATGTSFPDALGGVPAAARAEAPLLLVGSTVPPETRDEIRRLKPRKIVVLGSKGAVSTDVEYALEALLP